MSDKIVRNEIDIQSVPGWWEREKQRRQLRILILLCFLLGLIAFFYYVSALGRTGIVNGVNFDTSNHIAFVRQDANGATSLYTVRADGTDLVRLTAASDNSDKSAPAWTVDGTRLLYASNRQDSKKTQIYILGAGDPVQLTYGPGRKDSPQAVPGGQYAAFITQGAIKTVQLNGEAVTQLLPEPRAGNEDATEAGKQGDVEPTGPYLSAVFSSDGASVAGTQELDPENGTDTSGMSVGDQVARAYPSGASRAAFLNSGHYVSSAWDPNGKRLLVDYAELPITDPITHKSREPIYASGLSLWSFENPNRPIEKQLIVCGGFGVTPRNIAWSPDGTRVACEAWYLKSEGVRELRGIMVLRIPAQRVTMTARQSQSVPIPLPITDKGVPSNPRWSPDGSRLLFQMTRPDHKNDLWVINKDFTNAINLTKGVGDNTQGVWAPARAK